jgi:hypothetical protein
VKIGIFSGTAQLQILDGPWKSVERSVLANPNVPVRDIVGKYRDLATPILALAAIRVCSA